MPLFELTLENSPNCPLWRVLEPPKKLYVECAGEESLSMAHRLPERGLGVVGSRNPSLRALQLTHRNLRRLKSKDLIILSGFARGIDAMAHRSAIEIGAPTIAILGCGLDINYPREHQSLRRSIIASGGWIVTEFDPGTPAYPNHFRRRNRLIAGWSRAVWVVEAGIQSGALITARWAADGGADLYATPGFPDDPSTEGNQRLLDIDGAHPFWGAHSLAITWPSLLKSDPQSKPAESIQFKTPAEAKLYQVIQQRERSQGGATWESLYDWGIRNHWTPMSLAALLEDLTGRSLVRSRGDGVFTTIDRSRV